MMRSLPRLRGFAAVLAAVALLSAAARPVLACEVGQGHHGGATPAPALAAHDGYGDAHATAAHADHAPAAAPAAPIPTPDEAPGCDHVVGCATMVVTVAPALTVAPVLVVDAAPTTHHARVDAPAPALEPPPPKA